MIWIIKTVDGTPIPGTEQPLPETYENISHPTLDQMIALGWAEYQVPLTALREQAWLNIKAMRDNLKSGGVLVAGKWFNTDADSRIQQIGLVMFGANLPAVQWKTMDGSFTAMTPTLAQQIFQAVATLDMTNFAVAENHREAMLQSSDPLSYDYSAGWMPVYGGA